MSKIFFCRHADCWSGNRDVSEEGKKDLSMILTKLSNLGFDPKKSISTKAVRCVQTARILVPNVEPIISEELPLFCYFKDRRETREQTAGKLLAIVDAHLEDDKDMVIVTHDLMSTLMAFRLIEKRGGLVSWDSLPESLTWLEMGCGLLVEGTNYIFIEP